nr:MAG TPA: hypothetical protein [Caudoviricetes sp.]
MISHQRHKNLAEDVLVSWYRLRYGNLLQLPKRGILETSVQQRWYPTIKE